MKISKLIILILLFLQGCIVQFLPEAGKEGNDIVVDGLVTDQNNSYKIAISRTSPLGKKFTNTPIKGCLVSITDDLGNQYLLKEKKSGQYFTDSLVFRGIVGRKYTLHVTSGNHQYESIQMEMKAVPAIDSINAELINNYPAQNGKVLRGYQIYVTTHDPTDECKFYRWDFTETWEFSIPYTYPTIVNRTCWKTASSNQIYIDNTSAFKEDKVSKFALNFITTETDRLKVKYSLIVRQYSLDEDEYNYWGKLKRINEEVGGLYDVVPTSIESNIYCTDSPQEKVLGYFSVSPVSSKRIFITNSISTPFQDYYDSCPYDTVPVGQTIPDLNISTWIIAKISPAMNVFNYVLTKIKGCADCTVDGSNKKPDFWDAKRNDVVIPSDFR